MLVRAYDDTDARMQEEVLKKTVSLATKLDPQVILHHWFLLLVIHKGLSISMYRLKILGDSDSCKLDVFKLSISCLIMSLAKTKHLFFKYWRNAWIILGGVCFLAKSIFDLFCLRVERHLRKRLFVYLIRPSKITGRGTSHTNSRTQLRVLDTPNAWKGNGKQGHLVKPQHGLHEKVWTVWDIIYCSILANVG